MSAARGWTWIVSGVLVAAGALYAAGDRAASPQPNGQQQSALMLAKLASSQKVVAGLVSKDFEEIHRGAAELMRICEATEWAARGDQVYAHHRTELHRQAQKLVKMADEKNLDGAAFAYMHSLTTCISCHDYCRDVLHIADETRPMNRIVPIPVSEDEPAAPARR